jgi:DNA-binding transcriptional ArsR family regulator
MPEWTFITRHAVALSLISKDPRITALELSAAMGITERAVRKVIADLYNAGYISKKRRGRGVRYRINPDATMRQDTHREIAIGDLLESLGWKRSRRQSTKKAD